jgi:NADPH-dependent glutamate synthase beta subunit-like oxidoreductase/NAD(P)H-flavin reductase
VLGFHEELQLDFGLTFKDLYDRDGLLRLDDIFRDRLKSADPALHGRLLEARSHWEADRKAESDLILALAPRLEEFITALFGIDSEVQDLRGQQSKCEDFYTVKRKFIHKRALTGMNAELAAAIDGAFLERELEALFGEALTDFTFAENVARWMRQEAQYGEHLRKASHYAAWATLAPAGKARQGGTKLFRAPSKIDPYHLVPVETLVENGFLSFQLNPGLRRFRDGFDLTDEGGDLLDCLDEANYCIKCHNQQKDSCSTGLIEKDGQFKKSAFGVNLNGCPLDEKISEMNTLKLAGYTISALATIVIDNPICAGTGHRICNDCVKACIFQKQEPVDIPQIETGILKDSLTLPWGFEIYSLLTRWNPLNFRRPLPKPETGYKVLVVGLGPAGITLSHHLLNDGHTVIAIDGLKIEPLSPQLSGVTPRGERVPFSPVHDVNELFEPLAKRAMAGFGGVAEYGITVRWNKNFLKLERLLLERRSQFAMMGGVRFGGALTVDDAFEMGFDHIALCAGAGKPTVIPMKNGLARGVRQASDFLMSLQLTGAAKPESIANLQLRLPIVVIGGGLTAIDTATESLAYYVVQVEKFLSRYEVLVAESGEAAVRARWSAEDTEVGDEFLKHAQAIRVERRAAAREKRKPNLIDLLNSWGGVTIAYRRRLIDSPSYTLNHEEVAKALEEGIRFAECLNPEEVELDEHGHARAVKLTVWRHDAALGKLIATGETVVLPAKSVLVAAGTQPNTVLAREDAAHFPLDGKHFQAIDENGIPVRPDRTTKPSSVHVLVSMRQDQRAVSFFGDLHPSFAGNVVKAMSSAKQGYPIISRMLARRIPSGPTGTELMAKLHAELRAVVHEVIRLTPNIVEVVFRAPLAARAFRPGQFYRLQNYAASAPRARNTVLAMEGLALTGASVDLEAGLLSTVVLEVGGSSDLCVSLRKGEPVSLMGPTGMPTELPEGETVLLAGGGLGNAVLFSIGQQLRAKGSRVIYFAGYKKVIDRYKIAEIKRAADVVVWTCDEAPGFPPDRPQDRAYVGSIVDAMLSYASGRLGGPPAIPLNEISRIVAIGSDGMMAAVARARHSVLAPYLPRAHKAFGSINSPMQCMMKEICAQCLQTLKDPKTGEETVVFTCFNQDQELDAVDWATLRSRLSQNGAEEKLTAQWIDHCLREIGLRGPGMRVTGLLRRPGQRSTSA